MAAMRLVEFFQRAMELHCVLRDTSHSGDDADEGDDTSEGAGQHPCRDVGRDERLPQYCWNGSEYEWRYHSCTGWKPVGRCSADSTWRKPFSCDGAWVNSTTECNLRRAGESDIGTDQPRTGFGSDPEPFLQTPSSPKPDHCQPDPGPGSVSGCAEETVCSESRRLVDCTKFRRRWVCINQRPDPYDDWLDVDGESRRASGCRWVWQAYTDRCREQICNVVEKCTCDCPRCAALGGALSGIDGVQMSRNRCEDLLRIANHSWGISCEGKSDPAFSAPCRMDVLIGGVMKSMPCSRPG